MHKKILIATLVTTVFAQAVIAQTASEASELDLIVQSLPGALNTLAHQSGIQILFNPEELKRLNSPALKGKLSPTQALTALLAGSGFTFQLTSPQTYVILRRPEADPRLPEVSVKDQRENSYRAEKAFITGKVASTPKEIPQSVSILTRKQMDDQDMVSMTEAMKQLTGTTVIANDNLSNQYLVRGYGLGVMYDGIPSFNGMNPSHQFDTYAYEQIEVLRGPAGLMRGSGEPGGVVNLVKKRPVGEFSGNAEVSIGAWNFRRTAGDIGGALNTDKTLRGRLVVSEENRNFFYAHSQSEKWLGMGALEFDLNPETTLSLSYTADHQKVKAPWYGLPAIANLTDPNNGVYPLLNADPSTNNVPDWNRMSYDTQETALSVERRSDSGWTFKAAYNHREQTLLYKYAYTYSGINPVTGLLDYRSQAGESLYTRDGFDVFANGPFELFGRKHNLLLGFNSEIYLSQSRSGAGATISNVAWGDLSRLSEPTINYTSGSKSETTQSGLYTQARFSVSEPLTLILGGRWTTFNARSRKIAPSVPSDWTQGAKASNEFTPYGALIYALTPAVNLYASYADIFVPQTQLKADGSTLDPRVGRQYEIGTKISAMENLLISASAFDIRDKNRAYADPAYPTSNFYLNAGEVESKGWEIEATGSPIKNLELTAGYTRLMTRYLSDPTSGGKTFSLPSPEHQIKVWANYRFDGESALAGWSAGAGLLAQSATQSSRGWRDQLLNSGYAVVNARIAYQINQNYDLSLLVNNVFDLKYYETVGTPNSYNYYGEPRNAKLTLKFKF